MIDNGNQPIRSVQLKNTSLRFSRSIFFLIVSILAVTSHMRTMLTDPGAVPVGYSPSHLLHEEKGTSGETFCSPKIILHKAIATAARDGTQACPSHHHSADM